MFSGPFDIISALEPKIKNKILKDKYQLLS